MEFRPAGSAEVFEWIKLICLKRGANLLRCHVGARIDIDNSTATILRFAQDIFAGHEPNAAQDPVERHEFFRPFQRMHHCIEGQARRLRDEFPIQGLSLA